MQIILQQVYLEVQKLGANITAKKGKACDYRTVKAHKALSYCFLFHNGFEYADNCRDKPNRNKIGLLIIHSKSKEKRRQQLLIKDYYLHVFLK